MAARAGVSHQTVSRVINGHDNVSAATRERVLGAIEELQYVPSPMARGLISNRTHSLGLVTADISDHFFAEVVAGAEVEARRRGYYLMIASVEEAAPDDETGYLRLMLERRVEGLIIARPSVPLSTQQLLPAVKGRMPFVAVSIGSSRVPGFTVVDVDNRRGGFDATRYLVEQGHRRIATITGPLEWPSAKDRLEGYRDALREAGVAGEDGRAEHCADWGLAEGQRAAAKLLDRDEFTAIFAQSDLAALGAIQEVRARGLRVPEDISVVGYDDIPVAAFVDPPLTTVSQPMRQVGELAASLVLDAIAGEDDGGRDGEVRLLPAKLTVRKSAAPPARI